MVGGSYDITGFHTTGRQRLTQGLMAGHMRSQRTSIFPSHTTIINNIGTCHYADYGCYDTHSYDSTPKWASWLMGGGMIASFLGGIFGGGKSEGAGGASDNTDNNAKLKDDIKALQKQFPDAKLSTLSDGTILCNGTKCKDIDEALDLLNKPDTPEIKDEGDKKLNNKNDDNGNEPLINSKADFGKIFSDKFLSAKFNPKQGLKIGDKYYANEIDAYEAYTGGAKPVSADSDLSEIFKIGTVIGVFDDGKDATGKEIADFSNAQVTAFDAKNKIVTIGNHKYKVNTTDGYIHLTDMNPSGGNSNKQEYMLELKDNSYSVRQRNDEDLRHNVGTGKIAHK